MVKTFGLTPIAWYLVPLAMLSLWIVRQIAVYGPARRASFVSPAVANRAVWSHTDNMRFMTGRNIPGVLAPGILFVLGAMELSAAELQYLRKNESFCDSAASVCLHGTISYRANSRLLQLRARVVKAPGPGRLTVNVVGKNRLEHLRRAAIEITINGRASEIVNHDMIPDAPDVYSWEIQSIAFEAD